MSGMTRMMKELMKGAYLIIMLHWYSIVRAYSYKVLYLCGVWSVECGVRYGVYGVYGVIEWCAEFQFPLTFGA